MNICSFRPGGRNHCQADLHASLQKCGHKGLADHCVCVVNRTATLETSQIVGEAIRALRPRPWTPTLPAAARAGRREGPSAQTSSWEIFSLLLTGTLTCRRLARVPRNCPSLVLLHTSDEMKNSRLWHKMPISRCSLSPLHRSSAIAPYAAFCLNRHERVDVCRGGTVPGPGVKGHRHLRPPSSSGTVALPRLPRRIRAPSVAAAATAWPPHSCWSSRCTARSTSLL